MSFIFYIGIFVSQSHCTCYCGFFINGLIRLRTVCSVTRTGCGDNISHCRGNERRLPYHVRVSQREFSIRYWRPFVTSAPLSRMPVHAEPLRMRTNVVYFRVICEDCTVANEIDYAWTSIHDNGQGVTASDVVLQQRTDRFTNFMHTILRKVVPYNLKACLRFVWCSAQLMYTKWIPSIGKSLLGTG